MAELKVADVSRWQGTINWDIFKDQVDAVVIKATGSDGGMYTDSMLARNRDEARRTGVPRWFYHYKGSGTAAEQAKYMIAAVGNLQAGEALVIDDENEAKVNVQFCADFADTVKQITGINVPVYSNLSRFQGVNLTPLKERNLGAWVAKYGQNGGTIESAGTAPSGIDMTIMMWQYTSAARVAGVTANTVDMNVFYGSREDFLAYGAKGAVSVPTAPAPSKPATGNGTYTVVDNDNLIAIGSKLGVAWQTIAATNGIVAPYTIFPGQVLRVYGGTTGQAAQVAQTTSGENYIVVKNDTLSGIASKTGRTWQELASLNGIVPPHTIFPGQVIKLSGTKTVAAPRATYTVVFDDNLSVIAKKTGKSWQDIAKANGIVSPFTIYPNQVLILP